MPKFYKINKNIFILTPSFNIYGTANVNFIIDKQIVLIDVGMGNNPGSRKIQTILESLRISPPRIDKIIITHSHTDHFTGAGILKKKFNSEIMAHPIASKAFKNYEDFKDLGSFEFWDFIEKTFPSIRRTLFLKYFINFVYKRGFGKFKPFIIDRKLEEGDDIYLGNMNLRVIFTPGHSPDSICLYEPNKKILFTGDTIPWSPYIHTSISDFRNSIQKLLELDVKLAIRGHGRPILWTEEKPKYIEFLKDMEIAEHRILKILRLKGRLTAHEMANSIFQRTHFIHKTLYTNIGRVSVYWIFKYLEDLEREGKIKHELVKNKIIYSLN